MSRGENGETFAASLRVPDHTPATVPRLTAAHLGQKLIRPLIFLADKRLVIYDTSS